MASFYWSIRFKTFTAKKALTLLLPILVFLVSTSCSTESDSVSPQITLEESIQPFEVSFLTIEDSSATIHWNNPYNNLSEVNYSITFKGPRIVGDSVVIDDLVILDYMDTSIVFSKILIPKVYYEIELEAITSDTSLTQSTGFRTEDIDFRSTLPTDIIRYDANNQIIQCIEFQDGFLLVFERNEGVRILQDLLFLNSKGEEIWRKEVGFSASGDWEHVVNLESFNSEIILYIKKENSLILRHYDLSGNLTSETLVQNTSVYDFLYRGAWQSGDLKWNGSEYIAAFSDNSNTNSSIYFTRISKDGIINVIDSIYFHGLVSHVELTTSNEYIISINEDHQSGEDYLMMTDINGNIKWSTNLNFIFPDGFLVKRIKYDPRHGIYFIASAIFTYPFTGTIPVVGKISSQGDPLWVNSANYSKISSQLQDLYITENGGVIIAGGAGADQTPVGIYEFNNNGYYLWHNRFYPYDDFRNNKVAGVYPSSTGGFLLFATATTNLGLSDDSNSYPFFVTLNEFGRL